jgi:hypothetical protein
LCKHVAYREASPLEASPREASPQAAWQLIGGGL